MASRRARAEALCNFWSFRATLVTAFTNRENNLRFRRKSKIRFTDISRSRSTLAARRPIRDLVRQCSSTDLICGRAEIARCRRREDRAQRCQHRRNFKA
eukprot:scaffold170272_cov33-Tisochrysis_lutea.AAC.4